MTAASGKRDATDCIEESAQASSEKGMRSRWELSLTTHDTPESRMIRVWSALERFSGIGIAIHPASTAPKSEERKERADLTEMPTTEPGVAWKSPRRFEIVFAAASNSE
jgi:hypothetical protein